MSQSASLRDQQAEFTKRLLLDAARKVILSTNADEFTMQKVAEEAGVSHRTVYRYFPSRQALIDEFSNFLEAEFDSQRSLPENLNEVGDMVRTIFSVFDKHSEHYEAAGRLSGGNLRPANQARRTVIVRAMFDREFPNLDPEVAEMSFSVIRFLVGLQTWYTMRDRFGLKNGQAGEAVAWATEELFKALKEGRTPGAVAKGREGEDTRE